jgi:hypothetical protein
MLRFFFALLLGVLVVHGAFDPPELLHNEANWACRPRINKNTMI